MYLRNPLPKEAYALALLPKPGIHRPFLTMALDSIIFEALDTFTFRSSLNNDNLENLHYGLKELLQKYFSTYPVESFNAHYDTVISSYPTSTLELKSDFSFYLDKKYLTHIVTNPSVDFTR